MPDIKDIFRHNIFKMAVILFFILLLLFLPAVKALTIKDEEKNKLLHCVAVDRGDYFSIWYLHSVNKSPVEDFFYIGPGNCIILSKSVFYSFGAGVPSASSDGGEFRVYEDRIEVTGINRRIDDFFLFIGVTADHRFRMNGGEVILSHVIAPQKNIRIAVNRVSLADLLLH